MSDAIEKTRAALLDEIDSIPLTARRLADTKIRWTLRHMVENASTQSEAMIAAGYTNPHQSIKYWKDNYPEVQQLYRRCADFSLQIRGGLKTKVSQKSGRFASPETLAAHQSGLLYDPDREHPESLGFAEFRWEYLGFPTADHHKPAVAAMEDMTNLAVFIFGPPGMGKDALAMQYTLWRAPARAQSAFFMSSAEFSSRRGRVINGYLTNPSVYKTAPNGVPGGQVPPRSMIYDYGPFEWKQGMTFPDGSEVPRPKWTQYEKYFVSAETGDVEPNLWFSGVSGATYGSRIQDAILSDLWPPDKIIGPDELQKDFSWVQDTLETRLDDDGRLIVLGTMLPWQNNYVRLIAAYTDGAIIIEEDEYTQKFSNGTAVVKIPALRYLEGVATSYWPVKFPLESYVEITHKNGTVEALPMTGSDEDGAAILKARDLQNAGKATKVRTRRGLLYHKTRNPINFRALYMQEDVTAEIGDFTDSVLDMAYDGTRTFGRWDPSEILVLGVDPAKTFGAAWWLWAVSRPSNTMTLVDFAYHEALGVQGIKDRLVVEPIVKYRPAIFAYEVNRHEAILEDAIVTKVFTDFGVKLYKHQTTGVNRGELGVLSTLMRVGQLRLPAMTKEDRDRLELVRHHFKAYDLSIQSARRSKPGTKTHIPDDIAFAAWIGSIPAREILDGTNRQHQSPAAQLVPSGVLDRWESYKQGAARRRNKPNSRHLDPNGTTVSGLEAVSMFATRYNESR